MKTQKAYEELKWWWIEMHENDHNAGMRNIEIEKRKTEWERKQTSWAHMMDIVIIMIFNSKWKHIEISFAYKQVKLVRIQIRRHNQKANQI